MVALLVFLLFRSTAPVGPIDVVVDRVEASDSRFVVINVANRSAAQLNDVQVSLFRGRPVVAATLGTLVPSQQRAAIIPIPSGVVGSIVIVSFKSGATQMSVARVLPVVTSRPNGSLTPVVPAVMTLIGTLAGAILAHVLSLKRERVGQDRSARFARMAAATTAINSFLTNWNASILPNVLETQYSVLTKTVLMPTCATAACNQTLQVLRDVNAGASSKRAAAAAFADRIRILSVDASEWG